jgi:hypothetical protein
MLPESKFVRTPDPGGRFPDKNPSVRYTYRGFRTDGRTKTLDRTGQKISEATLNMKLTLLRDKGVLIISSVF